MKIAAAPDGAGLLWDEAGDGDPLLLLAGQATGMAGWGPTADALARHFRVIRYDHRGVGGSAKGDPECYTTRLLAADAAAVLDAAGAGAAHVYGHSMGGRIAQWLAIDHPERVRTLVLAATSGGRRPGAEADAGSEADAGAFADAGSEADAGAFADAGSEADAGAFETALKTLLSGDPELMTPLFFDPRWAADHPDAVRSFFGTKASAWAKARHFQASRAHDAWDSLHAVGAPTLILHGTADALTPLADAVQLHRGIRRSTLVTVPGARHGLHLDHPETVTWIRQFIAAKALPGREPARRSGPSAIPPW